MPHRIEISLKPDLFDAEGEALRLKAERYFGFQLNSVRTVHVVTIDAADHEAWCRFTAIYRPLIYRVARRAGLQDADAADVTQDVFRSIARSIDGFQCERSKGSFRGWLVSTGRKPMNTCACLKPRTKKYSMKTVVKRSRNCG